VALHLLKQEKPTRSGLNINRTRVSADFDVSTVAVAQKLMPRFDVVE